MDNLLRHGALVDLYKVVREGICVSEPSYSIKYVEHFYRPAREGDVQNAGVSIVYYELWRETQNQQLLHDMKDYNRDDVVHTAIAHKSCAQGSAEEADLVAQIYQSALQQRYTDCEGVEHAMTLDNILVVAPYNVQVNLLKRTLPAGARVGTVDKFQSQEAELVIVSMTTSSEQDLPRNIEFLYSKNRLNVAISRARCTAIVIATPALMAIK